MRPIGSKDAVVDLLHEAVLLEEFMELSHKRRLFGLFDLEFEGEDVGDLVEDVFVIRLDESSHLSWLHRLLERLDASTDIRGLRERIVMNQGLEEPMPLVDAFDHAVRSENQAFRYFTMLSKSLRGAEIEGVDTERMADAFLGIAEAEQGHRDALQRIAEEYKDQLGKGKVRSTVDDLTRVHRLE